MSILTNNNGNVYTSNPDQGCRTSYGYRKRKYATKPKYNKFADMALTPVQKKQVQAMAKRQALQIMELKYQEASAVGQAFTQAGVLVDLCLIAQSNTDSGRSGDEIMLRDIELRWRCELTTQTAINGACRCIILQDYDDGSQVSVTPASFLNQTGAAASYLAPYYHDRRQMFKILYDEIIDLSGSGPVGATRVVKVYPGRKKVRYVGSGNTGEGKIFLLFIGDNAAGAATFDYYARVNYVDA